MLGRNSVELTMVASSLKDYLKKYTSEDDEQKKMKRKKKPKPENKGVLVVDEDPIWQKSIKPDEEEEESADEEKPQIDEDIEVKRMKKLEILRSKRPFGAISEDGSGWVSVSNVPDNDKPEGQDSDISPPSRRLRNDTPSPKSIEHEVPADNDLSPPRKRNSQTKPMSKNGGQKARHDSPSPVPKMESSQTMRVATDLSPPRRQRLEKYSMSPEPSRKPKFTDSDISPRRKRDGQAKPLSIPGGRKARYDTPSPDPYMETSQPNRETTDLSPPRRHQTEKHTMPPEPNRKSRLTDPDISPPRRSSRDAEYEDGHRPSRARDRSESSLSRKSDHNFNDNSIGATAHLVSDLSPPRRRKRSPPPVKTGLVSGSEIKQEIDKTRKEDWLRFQQMDPSVSGRDAEAIYRNKITGERMTKEEFQQSKVKKKEEKPKEIKLEWGKGLAQKREAEARFQELEEEKEMPFARSRDDAKLDKMLKERVRWGDPMAHLVKNKDLEPALQDLGDNEKMKESGFIIPQEIPKHSWKIRRMEAAPNRYGIKPGRHWDGVDRSTGYEKELFKRTNEKKATEREAYLWSVSEM